MAVQNVPEDHTREKLQTAIVNFLDSRSWGSAAPMIECARSMSMSPRTLRRRLAEDQTTFSEVFENWRITTARQLLSKHDMQITAIAAVLGYNHPSNFERAFKRWTGVSPSCFRANGKTR